MSDLRFFIRHSPISLFPLIAIIVLGSCERSDPVASDTSETIHTPLTAEKVRLELVDFNLLRVSTDGEIEFTGPFVDTVKLVSLDLSGQQLLGSAVPTVVLSSQRKKMSFSFQLTLPPTTLEPHVVVQLLSNGVILAAKESTIALYQYPYREARVVARRNEITTAPLGGSFQDIWLEKGQLYYHFTGPHGVGVLDLNTRISKELVNAGGGDHLAGGKGFLFVDNNHDYLLRYNLDSNKIDWNVRMFDHFPPDQFWGLEVVDTTLYAFAAHGSVNTMWLKRMSFEGIVLDSALFPYFVFHMTIHDGIVYSVSFSTPNSISRFDLATKTVGTKMLAPAQNLEGIKIIGDSLYYCDYDLNIVGVIPFGVLKPVESAAGKKNALQVERMRRRE